MPLKTSGSIPPCLRVRFNYNTNLINNPEIKKIITNNDVTDAIITYENLNQFYVSDMFKNLGLIKNTTNLSFKYDITDITGATITKDITYENRALSEPSQLVNILKQIKLNINNFLKYDPTSKDYTYTNSTVSSVTHINKDIYKVLLYYSLFICPSLKPNMKNYILGLFGSGNATDSLLLTTHSSIGDAFESYFTKYSDYFYNILDYLQDNLNNTETGTTVPIKLYLDTTFEYSFDTKESVNKLISIESL